MSSSFVSIVLVILTSSICSWILIARLMPYLRLRLLDQPNIRSSHNIPKPRGGGISFVILSCMASCLDWYFGFSQDSVPTSLLVAPLVAFPLAFIGLLDDRFSLPAKWRYLLQLITALLAILLSPLFSFSFAFLPLLFLLIIAFTAVVNFINFMDGLDGLVSGCMALILTVAAFEISAPFPVWVLVGALLGFLWWNWSPSRIFMGDVGSTFLGAVFAMFVLHSSSWSQALSLLLIATPLLGDACICVLRRFIAGQQVFTAHRLHLFQRLHQAGWAHYRVATLYVAATATLAIAFKLGGLLWVSTIASVELLMGFWLDQHVAVRFSPTPSNLNP